MPRTLTDIEKENHKAGIFKNCRDIVYAYGAKVSVSDIAKASGISKGAFYLHFESKEDFFLQFITRTYKDIISKGHEIALSADKGNLKERTKDFMRFIFNSQDYCFITVCYRDIEEILKRISPEVAKSFRKTETDAYEGLLKVARIDTKKIKSAIIYNYLHIIHSGIRNFAFTDKATERETFEVLMNGLIDYIFQGYEEQS